MKDKIEQLTLKILLLLPDCCLSRTSITLGYFYQQKVRCHLISPLAESCISRDCVNLETWHLTVLFGSSIWVGFLLGDVEIAVVPALSSQGLHCHLSSYLLFCYIFNHLGDGYSDFPTNWLNVCLSRSYLTLIIVAKFYLNRVVKA